MKNKWQILIFLLVAIPAQADRELCQRFVFTEGSPELSDADEKILCGDPKLPGWNNVPINQSVFVLKTILQNQGYFNPKLEERNKLIYVDIGEPTRVKTFRIDGEAPKEVVDRLRHIKGEILKPSLLDSVQKRIDFMLQMLGYACPIIEMQGRPAAGELIAKVKTGRQQNIRALLKDPVEGLNTDVFSRYQTFKVGDAYNKINLAVTNSRLIANNIVQTSFYTVECLPQGVDLKQNVVVSPPRLLSFGLGLDTEQLLLLRGRWQNSRWERKASQITLGTSVSLISQEASADLRWFPFEASSRGYLRSTFQVKRENMAPYDRMTTKLRFAPGWTWDNTWLGVEGSFGPAGNLLHTMRGAGPAQSAFISLYGDLALRTHDFEYYINRPTTGFELTLGVDLVQKGLLAPITANKLWIQAQNNWNLFNFEPAYLILSLRTGFNTTLTPLTLDDSSLPSDYRHFLGGSGDLRGFALREVPHPRGALSSFYFGAEARFADLITENLHPYLFVDSGITGDGPWRLDAPVYWSPGAGLRWQSGFGVFRVNMARGFITREENLPIRPHWQFYFSYGEEF